MTETTQCAKLVKPVQKEEWINTFLIEVTQNPKITNLSLAEKYHCCRNTVSKYRKIIRERQLRTNVEIVNKIDNILEDRLPNMEDHDLISYRKAITPEKQEVLTKNLSVSQIKHVIELVDPDNPETSNTV